MYSNIGYYAFLVIGWAVALWRWGDWRNWQKYHATILYYIGGDLIYQLLLYNYRVWEYSPHHISVALVIQIIMFPCAVLVYLPHFPESGALKKTIYVILWGLLGSAIEGIGYLFDLINYKHGWNFAWSIGFFLFSRTMLRVHYKRPLLAYFISAIAIVILFIKFDVPFSSMK